MITSCLSAAPMSTEPRSSREAAASLCEARLWIDGVGCWLVCLRERLTIGGPASSRSSHPPDDLSLLADLQRRHSTIVRSGEHYQLEPRGPAAINGSPINHTASPKSGDILQLGTSVSFEFTIPTPLSNTARLICTSGHRPADRIDGILMMEQVCQLGGQPDHHIVCPRVEIPMILYQKGQELWCRSPEAWRLNQSPVTGAARVTHGDYVCNDDLSFRVEIKVGRD